VIVDVDLDPTVEFDGSEAIRRRLTPSSTSTSTSTRGVAVIEGSRAPVHVQVKGGGNDYVPLRCRQPQRPRVNDEVYVDDHGLTEENL
jgi:hypothetical protein